MREDAVRRLRARQVRAEARVAEDQLGGHYAVVDDAARAVHVGEKGVNRFDALDEPVR